MRVLALEVRDNFLFRFGLFHWRNFASGIRAEDRSLPTYSSCDASNGLGAALHMRA